MDVKRIEARAGIEPAHKCFADTRVSTSPTRHGRIIACTKLTKIAKHELKKLSPSLQKRIADKLLFYQSQDDPLIFAKRLTRHETGSYRFRIGDYRIIFDVEEKFLIILSVGHRREIYK